MGTPAIGVCWMVNVGGTPCPPNCVHMLLIVRGEMDTEVIVKLEDMALLMPGLSAAVVHPETAPNVINTLNAFDFILASSLIK